jgi:hypothetical protein
MGYIGARHVKICIMKPFRWSHKKNEALKIERHISFEEMVLAIEIDGLLDELRQKISEPVHFCCRV